MKRYNQSRKYANVQTRLRVRRILKEEISLMQENVRISNMVILKERKLYNQGYSRKEINEGIMDFLQGAFPPYIKQLKQEFIKIALGKLGISDSSILGCSLVNTLEEMEFTNIASYFGTGKCDQLANLILKGAGECAQEKFLNKISNMIFGKDLQGALSGTAREWLTNYVNEMTESLRQPLTDLICSTDFGGIATQIKDGITSLLGSGMKGISDWFTNLSPSPTP